MQVRQSVPGARHGSKATLTPWPAFGESGVYEDSADGPMVGPEQVREDCRAAMETITDCRVEIRHLLVDGPVAMAKGYFASRLADGSGRLDFPFVIIAETKGDLVSRMTEFPDTRPLVSELGTLSPQDHEHCARTPTGGRLPHPPRT
jgi:SnoaL-like domain